MKGKILKFLIALTFVLSVFNVTIKGEEAHAVCYPAYKCMSKSILPTSYKLYYTNKDRSAGIFAGNAVIGATGLIPGAGPASFLAAVGIGGYELTKGYLSYKVYIKRNPDSKKKGLVKTVHYKEKNFKGSTKTTYSSW